MYIESFDHQARGICRVNGKITFVENAIPNEELDIKIIKEKSKYNEAIITKINNASKSRVKPLCPYYDLCGGCHLQHVIYKEQLRFKQNKISNIIERYIKQQVDVNNIEHDEQFFYRNKVTLQVNNKLGFYKKHTNDLIEVDNCLICNKKINEAIKSLKKLQLQHIKQFIIRSSDKELLLIIKGSKNVDVTPIYNDFENIVIKDDKYYLKKGNNYLLKKINNITYKISLESFFQVNYNVMEKLYNKIKYYCNNSHKVLDLYCGTGSISLYISDMVDYVEGIEVVEKAVNDAIENMENNKINNVSFKCVDTKNVTIDQYYDTIIVDPPRSGLNKNIIDEILKNKSDKLIYVSCDPMTMVRDIKKLEKHYEITEITPFDMFPNTYHCESVCILERR